MIYLFIRPAILIYMFRMRMLLTSKTMIRVDSYEDDCFASLSEHGDAANADCGEERDY